MKPLRRFADLDISGGILLIACTVMAMVMANSPLADAFHHLWETRFNIGLGPIALDMSLHHWINDGLMAVFFLVVGLEIKREVLVGDLSSPRKAALPVAAAIGGMVLPALLFAAFNYDTPGMRGWGIPTATDIAFALGVLSLLGDRVPASLKMFLTALAVVDDLGAILIIAVFYTSDLSLGALGAAGVPGLERLDLDLAGVPVLRDGTPLAFDEAAASAAMQAPEVRIAARLQGPGLGRAWGCDLTSQYVSINADYRS